jgi:predicted DNA-binding transcriptional regulator AlpA
MKPKRIVREPEACSRLACRRTKFREHYRLNDPAKPNVPDTEIPRLRPVHLGPRNVGYLEEEIDALIDALAELRDTAPARTTRVFLTDSAAKLERERQELIQQRNILRAQLSGDPDPELRELIEQIDQQLRAFER